jgi:putative ABC transport system permease protein
MKKLEGPIIKILSLGFGLAIGAVLIAMVTFLLSFDKCFDDTENIYQIFSGVEREAESQEWGQVSGAIAPGMKEFIPEVVEATRLTGLFDSDKFYDEENNVIDGSLYAADSCFFKIFNREWLAGDWRQALCGKTHNVVVSKSFSEKFGCPQAAIGKIISNDSRRDLQFTIVGVYKDFPENSSFRHADLIANINLINSWSLENWVGNDRYKGYVKLAPGTDPASLSDAIFSMQKAKQPMEELEKAGVKLTYRLVNLPKVTTHDSEIKSKVVILLIVAILLILVATLNYLLVAVSEVVKRSKEVAVRKCYGASDNSIYGLLFKSAAVDILVSLVLAFALMLAFRGKIEELTGVDLQELMVVQNLIPVIAVIVLVFLVSAIIPARLFARIPVSSAFRGYHESKRKWKISLLVFQFIINTTILVLLIVISSQYSKLMNEDVGYDYSNLAYSELPGADRGKLYEIAEKLRTYPEVEGAELTFTLPFSPSSGNNVFLPGDDHELFNIADQYWATEGFFKLMGFRMVEGKAPSTLDEVAVSKSFVTRLAQFTDVSDGAIGKTVQITEHDSPKTICGVYEDYRIGSAVAPDTRPSARFLVNEADTSWYAGLESTIVVKLREMNGENFEKIKDVIREFLPDKDPEVTAYSDSMANLYEDTRKMRSAFEIGALFALLIALVGLVGYLLDEAERRSKEIAVRKVNGAESKEIVNMLVLDIMKLALVAIVIGDVLAWFVAKEWLKQFADKVSISPLYFIVADVVLLVIIAVTVALSSLRIARSNPADYLKND